MANLHQRFIQIIFLTFLIGNSVFTPNIHAESFVIESADHKNSLSFSFISQLRLIYEHLDRRVNIAADDKFKMESRRIRFIFGGTILDSELSYKLQLSIAPGSLELLDIYFNYKFKSGLQLRYGQFKTPFTSYRMNPFKLLHFSDWALVSKYFGAERQMGLAAHNGYNRDQNKNYIVGIFTGANARSSHGIGMAEIFDTEIANPSDLTDPGPSAEFHPEIFVYLSHAGSFSQGIRHGYKICFSAAWDFDPAQREDFGGRFAPEFYYYYKDISFFSAYYWGLAEIRADKSRPALSGYIVELAYRISAFTEISLRYAGVETDSEFRRRYEQYHLAEPPRLIYDRELTAGLNIDLLEKSLVWQNDFSWLKTTDEFETRDNYRVRSQLQLEF